MNTNSILCFASEPGVLSTLVFDAVNGFFLFSLQRQRWKEAETGMERAEEQEQEQCYRFRSERSELSLCRTPGGMTSKPKLRCNRFILPHFMRLHVRWAYQSSGIQLNSVLLHTNILQQHGSRSAFVAHSLLSLARSLATGTTRSRKKSRYSDSIYSTRSHFTESSFASFSFIGRKLNRFFFFFFFLCAWALSVCLQQHVWIQFANKIYVQNFTSIRFHFNSIEIQKCIHRRRKILSQQVVFFSFFRILYTYIILCVNRFFSRWLFYNARFVYACVCVCVPMVEHCVNCEFVFNVVKQTKFYHRSKNIKRYRSGERNEVYLIRFYKHVRTNISQQHRIKPNYTENRRVKKKTNMK